VAGHDDQHNDVDRAALAVADKFSRLKVNFIRHLSTLQAEFLATASRYAIEYADTNDPVSRERYQINRRQATHIDALVDATVADTGCLTTDDAKAIKKLFPNAKFG
jgi:hypothetical protein